jgi:hypothetical protein
MAFALLCNTWLHVVEKCSACLFHGFSVIQVVHMPGRVSNYIYIIYYLFSFLNCSVVGVVIIVYTTHSWWIADFIAL